MKLRVQELLEACATAPHTRVMEIDFKCLEFVEQRVHGWASFMRPNVRGKWESKAWCSARGTDDEPQRPAGQVLRRWLSA